MLDDIIEIIVDAVVDVFSGIRDRRKKKKKQKQK